MSFIIFTNEFVSKVQNVQLVQQLEYFNFSTMSPERDVEFSDDLFNSLNKIN